MAGPRQSRRTTAWRLLLLVLLLLLIVPLSAAGCLPGTAPPGGSTEIPPPAPGSGPDAGTGPAPVGDPAPAGDPAAPPPAPATSLRVHFLDVGQGDAILIQCSPGGTALIDGGPRGAGPAVTAYLRAQGVEKIDLLIATHPHADHIGGLIDVLGAFSVARVIDAGVPHTSDTFASFLGAVEAQVLRGGCVYETPERQAVNLASNVTVTVLGPDGAMNSINNSSVVCRLDFGSTSFLFPGDAEEPAERALVSAGKPLDADVLKVGHHGSHTSTSASFLAAVSPAHAVISVGTNTYGHPSSITLSRLAAAGVTVHRTDLHGHVLFDSDGTALQVVARPNVYAILPWPSGERAAAAGMYTVETAAAGAGTAETAPAAQEVSWP